MLRRGLCRYGGWTEYCTDTVENASQPKLRLISTRAGPKVTTVQSAEAAPGGTVGQRGMKSIWNDHRSQLKEEAFFSLQ